MGVGAEWHRISLLNVGWERLDTQLHSQHFLTVKIHNSLVPRDTQVCTYICSCDALLGHNEDEADENGRAQHADSTHQRVGALSLLSAEACGRSPDHDTEQTRNTCNGPEDQAGHKEKTTPL